MRILVQVTLDKAIAVHCTAVYYYRVVSLPMPIEGLHTKGTGTAPAWIPQDSSTDPLSSFNALLRLTLCIILRLLLCLICCKTLNSLRQYSSNDPFREGVNN